MKSFLVTSNVLDELMLTCLKNWSGLENWLHLFQGTFILVSSALTAPKIREVIIEVFPKNVCLVVELKPGSIDGWLPADIWSFINHPRAEGRLFTGQPRSRLQ